MAYDLSDRLVVGVALARSSTSRSRTRTSPSTARPLPDTRTSTRRSAAARVAFPFIQRLLGLNDLRPEDPLVEVIVLSRNDPTTGLRVMRSVESHTLPLRVRHERSSRRRLQGHPAHPMSARQLMRCAKLDES